MKQSDVITMLIKEGFDYKTAELMSIMWEGENDYEE